MAADKCLIRAEQNLEEGSRGKRFEVTRAGEIWPTLAIPHASKARAYLNRCGHIPVKLDDQPGDFFDASRLYLVCATHGVPYDPATGICHGGRCNRDGLAPLARGG